MGVLNTTPGTAVAGTTLTAAFWNAEVRDALTNLQSAWTSYTPALTASTTNPTLGTGSSVGGAYHQFGKTVFGTANVTFGTSGVVVGSGRYAISLPVAASTTFVVVGEGFYTDASGPTTFLFICRLLTSTTFAMYLDNQTAGVFGVGSAAPVVPAASDSMNLKFHYQAA